MGDTVVLVTAVARKNADPNKDFFPLTVNYVEKTYAAGRIPGGFFKREGRPTEKETLTSRLIDRPIRPLFPEGFFNEVQVVATVVSLNPDIDSDIPAMLGASAVADARPACRSAARSAPRSVGYKDGQYILNPTAAKLKDVEAGPRRRRHARSRVLMVESEADSLPEDVMLGAVTFGHEQMQVAIKAINELKGQAGKSAWDLAARRCERAARSRRRVERRSPRCRTLTRSPRSRRATTRIGRRSKKPPLLALAGGDAPKFDADDLATEFANLEYNIVRRKHPRGRAAHRRTRHARRCARSPMKHRRAAACARLGAVHAR